MADGAYRFRQSRPEAGQPLLAPPDAHLVSVSALIQVETFDLGITPPILTQEI